MHTRFRINRGKAVATAALLAIVASVAVVAVSAIAGGSVKPEHWGVIDRNTIGSPVADYRDGPYVLTTSGNGQEPPLGKGSLGIEVANPSGATEKAAFGNEVDFFGDPVAGLNQVGFHVFTTGENQAAGGASPNMPSIAFEIDPNGAGGTTTNFSTLVYSPSNSTPNQWSGYIDAVADPAPHWGLTGGQFNSPPTAANCGINGPRCTFAQVQAFLATGTGATILTVAVTKGRDFAWQGAVDGLRINKKQYDFESEPKGTHEKDAK